jgi:5-(carboxyamino)imidazole ribonucleotide synthase
MGINVISPGGVIGILGSGQLGRMLALAARPMGYRVHVLSPERESPAGQMADVEVVTAYEDLDAVRQFAQSVDVVTYEFENVPAETAVTCSHFTPLRPGAHVLHVAQNRLREKQFMRDNDLPVTAFAEVNSLADLEQGLAVVGCPAVLKTAVSGYDGKGQVKIDQPDEVAGAWAMMEGQTVVLEAWVDFERELSVVAAQGLDGSFAHYGLIANEHRDHILDVSVAPVLVGSEVEQTAVALVRRLMERLGVVGVLCVEFFLTAAGSLFINEIAPRPHNSGHLTIEGCLTSQFEQQLRAVCGLPFGDTRYVRPVAMVNLLGDLWQKGEPDWTDVLRDPHIKLHLYGKKEARPGRKMGHLTALGESVVEAEKRVREARQLLSER